MNPQSQKHTCTVHTLCESTQSLSAGSTSQQHVDSHREFRNRHTSRLWAGVCVAPTTDNTINPLPVGAAKRQNICISKYMHEQTILKTESEEKPNILPPLFNGIKPCVRWCVTVCVSVLLCGGKIVKYCEEKKTTTCFAVAACDRIRFCSQSLFDSCLSQPVEMLSKTLLWEGMPNKAKCFERYWC